MGHQDQSSRHRYLTISLPNNNMAFIFPPRSWKGMCPIVETEADKKGELPISDNKLYHP